MDKQIYYTAHQVIKNAANDNTAPKKVVWRRLFKISILIAPFIMWFLWPK